MSVYFIWARFSLFFSYCLYYFFSYRSYLFCYEQPLQQQQRKINPNIDPIDIPAYVPASMSYLGAHLSKLTHDYCYLNLTSVLALVLTTLIIMIVDLNTFLTDVFKLVVIWYWCLVICISTFLPFLTYYTWLSYPMHGKMYLLLLCFYYTDYALKDLEIICTSAFTASILKLLNR